ncbi:hypothetical protein Tco_1463417 [Tanacetum coccineum]
MTSSSADESPNHLEKTQTQNVQQIVTTTVSNNNAKFPYLKKDEYETWAMKMDKKNVGRDPKGNIIILPSVSSEEQIAVQRETKARTLLLQFGGNEESKKIRKSMLKQEFQEFRVSEDEGLHKGYDRALPSSWLQVAITLKAKGGLDYLNFDDLYNKLKSLKIDIKGGSS